jgi:large subunit ribosomal protein L25
MSHYQLNATKRTAIGHDVRKLRKQGVLPAVIYSKIVQPINIEFVHGDFIKAYKQVGSTGVIDITVDEKNIMTCIVHDLHVHPVTNKLIHTDLMVVDLKKKVIAEVPLIFVGESQAIKETGGILDTPHETIKVEALPDNLPSSISIDISLLKSHSDIIKVSDIPMSKDYTLAEEPTLLLASIISETVETIETQNTEVTETPLTE